MIDESLLTLNEFSFQNAQPFPVSQPFASEDAEDIRQLRQRIAAFRTGQEDSERFRHFRLTRGVYGQRQADVQMFRTKIPFGKVTAEQLVALADLAERVSNGKLHLTTRQNVQLHFVKLEDSVKVWEALAGVGMTAMGACGNTVRNITASPTAGIDPEEPFDVSPYVQAVFKYFLRNPICQDMGRKIKTAFSSSEKDSAFTYFHDFGFIPKIQIVDGQEVRGFKVLIGGGLGAQAMPAHVAHEFLEEDQLVPFMEASLRVFDRFGEREKRMKARMKFLLQKLGLPGFLDLVEKERLSLKYQRFPIDRHLVRQPKPPAQKTLPTDQPTDFEKYATWLKTNVLKQKQAGFHAVQVRVALGNLSSEQSRRIAVLVKNFAADDIRITVNQGLLLKYIRPEALPHVFNELNALGIGEPGFDSVADVTSCPGTDTCALGVTNSTALAGILENLVRDEFPHLVEETNLHIKISGCMNSCGQHVAASIGFHGSSLKRGELVVPAMQVLLGGGVDPDGQGRLGEKIMKLPSRRVPDAVRFLLNDFEENGGDNYFNAYFRQRGERYFYDLLKPLADLTTLSAEGFFDWGQESQYIQSIGTGECAGVAFDVVGAIVGDASQKVTSAKKTLLQGSFADAIYQAYTAIITGAKAALLAKDVKCNTQIGILDDFQKHYVATGEFSLGEGFADFPTLALQLNGSEPEAIFAKNYVEETAAFVGKVIALRHEQLVEAGGEEKLVVENHYKA